MSEERVRLSHLPVCFHEVSRFVILSAISDPANLLHRPYGPLPGDLFGGLADGNLVAVQIVNGEIAQPVRSQPERLDDLHAALLQPVVIGVYAYHHQVGRIRAGSRDLLRLDKVQLVSVNAGSGIVRRVAPGPLLAKAELVYIEAHR